MISNQILQNTIDGLKNITRKEISILDRSGKIVVTTEENFISEFIDGIDFFINSPAENQLVQGYQYFKVLDNNSTEYVILVKGEDEEAYKVGKITAFQVQSLLVAYKERYDRDNFIKNLLLDNLLLVDIYARAKKLHIENEAKRIIYLVETEVDKELASLELVRNIFTTKDKDFVTAVNEKTIILVKELNDKDEKTEIDEISNDIYNAFVQEGKPNVYISVGSIIYDLKNVSMSFKEAKMAIEVGKIFDENNRIVRYEQLGIGRLIYQLPTNLCRMFMDEVLHGISMSAFDEETLTTVAKFFENNLNVSETSRQLYIHRNTLVYRLDKLQKMTGLDLRNFDDAIIFKITLMVSKYMDYKNDFRY